MQSSVRALWQGASGASKRLLRRNARVSTTTPVPSSCVGQRQLHASASSCSSIFRHNRITNDWVVYATERLGRPNQFVADASERATPPDHVHDCPFCPTNEAGTGTALLSFDADDKVVHGDVPHTCSGEAPTWKLRVVRNKYPVVSQTTSPTATLEPNGLDFPRSVAGHGHHEVVIEAPLHHSPLSSRSVDTLELLIKAWVMRGRVLREDPYVRHVTAFKNNGAKAGASLHHPHAQMVALPILPAAALSRVGHYTRYCSHHGTCAVCSAVAEELEEASDESRIVALNDSFAAFVPYAALTPFQVFIVPRRHTHSALELTDVEMRDFASILSTVMKQLDGALDSPDYNLVVHNGPVLRDMVPHTHEQAGGQGLSPEAEAWTRYTLYNGVPLGQALHFYVDIFPRLAPGGMAGFEFGSGMFSNSSWPEHNAADLRNIVSL